MKVTLIRPLNFGGPQTTPAGTEVDLPSDEANDLIDRGVVTTDAKAAPAPKNKMQPAPKNK